MNNKEDFSPELILVLSHMCDMVGVNYNDLDLSSPTWYWEHTWTIAKEEEFIEWLAKLLYENTKIRKAILSYPAKDKKRCKAGARFFASMYGWKLITEDLDKLLETKQTK